MAVYTPSVTSSGSCTQGADPTSTTHTRVADYCSSDSHLAKFYSSYSRLGILNTFYANATSQLLQPHNVNALRLQDMVVTAVDLVIDAATVNIEIVRPPPPAPTVNLAIPSLIAQTHPIPPRHRPTTPPEIAYILRTNSINLSERILEWDIRAPTETARVSTGNYTSTSGISCKSALSAT
ncbi:hypothetical protein BT96DRAFT_994696 [Gymnopus androsaceus JB14]|uniref:Uncharacterized protein n=1 Tax=Gymnopus androsaceus JB14 TaxID=1447944 RepID=A0A6A4HPB4_9AGAR|nr:hypothetical protein BT96DRAFT_994696 [Gymnopus androsaceus JB14]